MPTYEYRCPKGHEFEEFQRISAEPVATCPVCGAQAQRLLSAGAGLLFKGSGFYITDYKKASGGEKGGEKGADTGGEKGGEKSGGSESGKDSGSSSTAGGSAKSED